MINSCVVFLRSGRVALASALLQSLPNPPIEHINLILKYWADRQQYAPILELYNYFLREESRSPIPTHSSALYLTTPLVKLLRSLEKESLPPAAAPVSTPSTPSLTDKPSSWLAMKLQLATSNSLPIAPAKPSSAPFAELYAQLVAFRKELESPETSRLYGFGSVGGRDWSLQRYPQLLHKLREIMRQVNENNQLLSKLP